MSAPRTVSQRIASVSRLFDQGKHERALAEVEELLETWPGHPGLHVMKANMLQLQNAPTQDFSEIKKELVQAVNLDKTSPEAAIELGHYLDAVEDDPKAAVNAYSDGVAAARRHLIGGLIGQAKAHRQLDQKEEFLRCVQEVIQLLRFDPDGKRTKYERKELKELLGELVINR